MNILKSGNLLTGPTDIFVTNLLNGQVRCKICQTIGGTDKEFNKKSKARHLKTGGHTKNVEIMKERAQTRAARREAALLKDLDAPPVQQLCSPQVGLKTPNQNEMVPNFHYDDWDSQLYSDANGDRITFDAGLAETLEKDEQETAEIIEDLERRREREIYGRVQDQIDAEEDITLTNVVSELRNAGG